VNLRSWKSSCISNHVYLEYWWCSLSNWQKDSSLFRYL